MREKLNMVWKDSLKGRPVRAALRGRCSHCGEGRLYARYLKLNAACPACAQDWSGADTGDGPAFFVSFGVLIITAPFFFMLPLMDIPLVAKIIGGLMIGAVVIGLTLWLLPLAKAILLNLQMHHKSGSAN
jgi:uncharacterized protein (DUF983 family)